MLLAEELLRLFRCSDRDILSIAERNIYLAIMLITVSVL